MPASDATKPAHKPNALIHETSPYLLQHAHNPVDWKPWGPDAFAEARRRGVPIFLSIGYSTCYWCHVMERESFEHEPTATIMNDRFVCIKVDREQRPDVDDIYMAATVIMTGSGGWPMSVFLEPESLKPIYCGTYFPREPKFGRTSFTDVLEGIHNAWTDSREQVLAQGDRLAGAVAEQLAAEHAPVAVGDEQPRRAVQALLGMADRADGGFGRAPKFPQPVFLELLLAARAQSGDQQTRDAIDTVVRTTLDKMLIGGVRDQIGGGFHRYSVDAHWTVPHFEKMLYDNAQLTGLYARAAALYDDSEYTRVVRATTDYVLREMTTGDEPGALGFLSAQDAEVDGREGLNYLWKPDDIGRVLDADDAALALDLYGLDAGTNFIDPHHPEDGRTNVLRLADRIDRLAQQRGMPANTLHARLEAINAKLLAVRAQRKQPRLDDKVLTAWNGLMIAGLVASAELLGEVRYYEAADHAARFIDEHMRDDRGTLLRSYRAGKAQTPAFLIDHAAYAHGLLALHGAAERFGGDAGWCLDKAINIARQAIAAFGDGDGGFYDTRADQDDLFVRARTTHDGVVPGGAGMMLGVLIGLHTATGDKVWLEAAGGALRSLSAAIASNPVGSANATRHLLRMLAMRDDLAGIYAFAGGAPAEPVRTNQPTPVTVLADRERIAVSRGTPAELWLELRIDKAYHIVAGDPGGSGEGLVPLRVGLVSGQGVAVYADYPPGEEYGVEGVGTIRVHHGVVKLRVAIEKADGVGPTPGRPILGVTYQACTDAACLAPTTVELDVAIGIV